MDYRYSLRRGSKKEICPNCGKREFKPYIDNSTGEEVGGDYGRCERINSCGYSLYPKTGERYEKPPVKDYVPPAPVDYVSKSIVESTFNKFRENTFFLHLVRLFGKEKSYELQSMYNIGTANHFGTIFWQQDLKGWFRTGKVMYYNPNGKRDKDRKSWFVHSQINKNFNFKQCFFGLHLVDGSKPVCLVESEKTAILMAGYYPDLTWVASGGSEMINVDRLSELPRLDYVFPDNGQREKWYVKTKLLSPVIDLSVDVAVEGGIIDPGSDIYDLFLTLKNNGTDNETQRDNVLGSWARGNS